MSGYGYTFQSFSTYNTSLRGDTRETFIKPFVPFVPKADNGNPSDGYVTKKTIVPVASKPYDDAAYHDDEWNHRPTSPVRRSPSDIDDFLTNVQNDSSRPAPTWSSILTSPDWRHSSQPKPYNGAGGHVDYGSNKPLGGTKHDGYTNGVNYGYGDYGNNKPLGGTKHDGCDGRNVFGDYDGKKEGCKPIGGTVRDEKHDGYNGPNEYGDHGNHGKKERPKLIGSPVKKDQHRDGYSSPNGYGGDYGNREGHKPFGSPVRKHQHHDGYSSPNGYGGDYGNREGHKPIGSPVKKHQNHDGYSSPNGYGGDYGNREGHRPIGSPVKKDQYDSYDSPKGYGGDHGNRERHRPIVSPVKIDGYDGSNGYGGYGDNNNKERHKPTGYSNGYGGYGIDRERSKPFGDRSPTRNHMYDDNDYGGNYHNNKEGYKPTGNGSGPKISSSWTAAPRKGTQLSQPTNDIEKALELLQNEAARLNGHGNNKPYEYDKRDGPTSLMGRAAPPTSKVDRPMDLVNETERLKNIVTGAPQSRPSMPIKQDTKPYAKFNLSSSQPRFKVIDGRGGYGTMDHREAEKKFNGMTI